MSFNGTAVVILTTELVPVEYSAPGARMTSIFLTVLEESDANLVLSVTLIPLIYTRGEPETPNT